MKFDKLKILLPLIFLPLLLKGQFQDEGENQSTWYDVPYREVSLIITSEGTYPEKVIIFEGEKIRLFVTSTTQKPSCLMIKGKDFFLSAEQGQISEATVYFEQAGKFQLYCPTGKVRGLLEVLPRKRENKRELASENKIKIWTPRPE